MSIKIILLVSVVCTDNFIIAAEKKSIETELVPPPGQRFSSLTLLQKIKIIKLIENTLEKPQTENATALKKFERKLSMLTEFKATKKITPHFFSLVCDCNAQDSKSSEDRLPEDLLCTIVQSGIGINDQDERGYSYLHNAVEYGYAQVTDLLLKTGAALNLKTKENKYCFGQTPLHVACSSMAVDTNEEIIKLLIARTMFINEPLIQKNPNGASTLRDQRTPLDIFLSNLRRRGNTDKEKVLDVVHDFLYRGATTSVMVRDLTNEYKRDDIAALLVAHGIGYKSIKDVPEPIRDQAHALQIERITSAAEDRDVAKRLFLELLALEKEI